MKTIGLFGNPNTGKSSLFNQLTGLRQKVGNFPGVTVDKSYATIEHSGVQYRIIDFPGTYSIYAQTEDERVVEDVFAHDNHPDKPDVLAVVVDASNLRRNLLLFSQLYDLGLPICLILNMVDLSKKRGEHLNIEALNKQFPLAKIIEINARVGLGKTRVFEVFDALLQEEPTQVIHFEPKDDQTRETDTLERYAKIDAYIEEIVHQDVQEDLSKSRSIDRILVHPIWGYLIFTGVLFLIFQLIFAIASYPMDWIDGGFAHLSTYLSAVLPTGVFTNLITQGIIPGLGGVLVFIPQIAILFFLLGILEETGYLARVVFLMDKLVRPFGLNGKSVVPLLSSVACAIPGVMSARTIPNWKERMTTILVAPLMSCSARIPVYTLLIALVIPDQQIIGIFNLQGMVLLGLYLLGVIAALGVAIVLKYLLKSTEPSFLILELPSYKSPRWTNIFQTVWHKVRLFVWDAGKIIVALSIILWALASYGPGDEMMLAKKEAENQSVHLAQEEREQYIASKQLEHSYMGHLGKIIEPVIQPLGYDWKIGIGLLTSFAAREVFVGSMATIYAVHDESDDAVKLIDRMRKERSASGLPVFTLATGLSLMVFYAFAMQCMATLAVVKRETKSWKWPIIQLVYMGFLAYIGAFVTYQIFA